MGGVVGLPGLEPGTSSLSAIAGPAPCAPAFPRVARDRQGRSNAFLGDLVHARRPALALTVAGPGPAHGVTAKSRQRPGTPFTACGPPSRRAGAAPATAPRT